MYRAERTFVASPIGVRRKVSRVNPSRLLLELPQYFLIIRFVLMIFDSDIGYNKYLLPRVCRY